MRAAGMKASNEWERERGRDESERTDSPVLGVDVGERHELRRKQGKPPRGLVSQERSDAFNARRKDRLAHDAAEGEGAQAGNRKRLEKAKLLRVSPPQPLCDP
jgi:hypothetical protein